MGGGFLRFFKLGLQVPESTGDAAQVTIMGSTEMKEALG